MVADAVNTSGTTNMSRKLLVPECNLSADMATLIDKGLFSDVTLAVGSAEFKAHKAVLAGTYMHGDVCAHVCVCVCVCVQCMCMWYSVMLENVCGYVLV